MVISGVREQSTAREERELLFFANLLESLTHLHSVILNILSNSLLFVCVLLHCCSSSEPQQGPVPALGWGGKFHVTKEFKDFKTQYQSESEGKCVNLSALAL